MNYSCYIYTEQFMDQKTSKNPASQNIIPHNNWVPVCNFIYTKLAEKPMGIAGVGPLPWRRMNFTFFSVSFGPKLLFRLWTWTKLNHTEK